MELQQRLGFRAVGSGIGFRDLRIGFGVICAHVNLWFIVLGDFFAAGLTYFLVGISGAPGFNG